MACQSKTKHEIVHLTDGGGETISFCKLPDGTLVTVPLENFDCDAVKKMTLRDDDIILCSYPRTGCHWLWEHLRLLMAGTTDVEPANKQLSQLDLTPVPQLDQLPSPRILNAHLLFQHMPEDVTRRKGVKLVLVYRHPKDVAVSLFHLYKDGPDSFFPYANGQLGNYLQLFMKDKVDYGGYAGYLNVWAKAIENNPDLNVHILSYEGLKKRPLEELRKLSKFLGKECEDSFLQEVTHACAFDTMKKSKAGQNWANEEGQNVQLTLFLREGKSGGWKNRFTVAMSEQFDSYWSNTFTGSNIFPIETCD